MNFKALAVSLLWMVTLASPAIADDLDEIKARGTLIVGVKDATPPFGVLDPKTQTISGYDIDFAAAIAKRLGVKLLAKAVDSAERIPKLQAREVDLVIATMTKNAEREKQVDFSGGYFVTGQKFAVRKGKVKNLEDLTRSTIGTVKGSTSEKQLRKEMPNAKVVLFEDYDLAFHALGQGQLDAVSTDEPILAGQLNKMANKAQFEITDVSISIEVYGVAMRKGEKRLQKEVNDTLVGMEQSGEAQRIFDRWFGPQTSAPLMRLFKINSK
ncbi:transporter substrate-binding domain-containing protein [Chitinimonas sp.]|uniref:transporter substrate-binding domain-containing protein n=1 Tax=Chitinimonas sp. TaxID=1934313 RepID=UPI0035B30B98